MNGVSVQMKVAKDLPLVQGDRVHTATGYGQFDHQRRGVNALLRQERKGRLCFQKTFLNVLSWISFSPY